ncbi:splicing factor 3B subunit 4 isoform X1 [Jatropha curcas]|uniref:splicing factor 3B subunit 4 isoform X1 n=1 Tax=Jatropha curcas TaxID=180498 RepID=UPI0018950A9D|nr:splicing factor 3B subunit 4 isoform X1 [Jatropha curcas]
MTTRIAPGVGANLLGQHSVERNQDATAYVSNLDPQVSEELLWELFVQAGTVVNVYVPKDRVTNLHQGYRFVEFRSEEDADYAIKVLNMIKLYGKPIRVNKATQDKKSLDVRANLFIGNLDPDVDEKLLHDTFSAFGVIVINPKIMRDPETGNSRSFGFISYDSFESSVAAIEREFWLQAIQVPKRAGLTLCLLVGLQRFQALLRPMEHRCTSASFPFANGAAPPSPIPALRPPPPPNAAFSQMQVAGQPAWQGQPPQPGQAVPPPVMAPPQMQFRPPPPNMPPPLPQAALVSLPRPPPPAMGMGMGIQPQVWRQPPPPQQLAGGPPMQQMLMHPPPPPPPS